MNRSRVTGDLASHGNIFVDIANDRVGIGSTIPGEKLSLPDSAKIALGNSADLKIYHNGSDTYFETASTAGQIIHTANEWRLQNLAKNENMILANQDGLVRLFHDGSTRFETTAYGVMNTGTINTGGLIVSGVTTATGNIIANGSIDLAGDIDVDGHTNLDNVSIVGVTTFNGLSSNDVIRVRSADSNGNSVVNILSEGTTGNSRILFSDTAATSGDGWISYSHNDRALTFATAGTSNERLRIDSSGRLIVGGGTDPAESTIVAKGNSTSATSYSVLDMRRGQAATSDGDVLGYIRFSDTNIPSSNNNYGLIFGACDGASSGAGDNPGRLVFSTTADSASGPTERLRITSAGNIEVQGTRAGALQANDDDALKLFTKSATDDINRGVGITFYTHDGSGYEMGGTIQVAKENGTTNDAKSYMRFSTQSGSTTTERLRITSDGKIGIGNVTSPDNNVEIRTDAHGEGILIKSTGNTSNALTFDANRSGANNGISNVYGRWNGTTVAQMSFNTGSDTTDKNDGYIWFGTESAASNGNVNATERLRIDSSGRLYLGSNFTGGNSDVDDLVISGTGNKGITICSTDGGNVRLTFADGLSGTAAVIGSIVYEHGSTNAMDFYTNALRMMRVDRAGSTERLQIGAVNNNSAGTRLVLGAGNNVAATAVINTQDANINALFLSNWDGSTTTNKVNIHFDCSGIAGFDVGIPAATTAFKIANTSGGGGYLNLKSTGETMIYRSDIIQADINNSVSGHKFVSQCDDNEDGFEIYQQHGSTATRYTFACYDNRSGSKGRSFGVRGDGKSIFYGDVLPSGDNVHDLGSDSYTWDNAYIRNAYPEQGSEQAVNGSSFSNGTWYDTGFQRNSVGGLDTNGTYIVTAFADLYQAMGGNYQCNYTWIVGLRDQYTNQTLVNDVPLLSVTGHSTNNFGASGASVGDGIRLGTSRQPASSGGIEKIVWKPAASTSAINNTDGGRILRFRIQRIGRSSLG